MFRRAPGRSLAAALMVVAIAMVLTMVVAAAATSWAIVSSPNPGTQLNLLSGVACPDTTHCWAVGRQLNTGGQYQTLIEQWNGSSWSAVASDNTNNINNGSTLQQNELDAIACTSSTNCWAVGFFFNNSTDFEPLWDHWNGTSWTASTLAVGVTNYWLTGVSCVDANNCWTVGYKNGGTSATNQVFIEQWNGTSWSNNSATDAGRLNGVSCVDTSHCWAVGINNASPSATLVEKWNGTAWSLVSGTPNQGTSTNQLSGVSCPSTTSCWAVGTYLDTTGGRNQNLFEGFDGSSWTIPSGTAATNNNSPTENTNALTGVTCTATSNCWAVGSFTLSGTGVAQTLIDQFTGSGWSLVPNTPDTTSGPANGNVLFGVACADAGHCAAVGDLFEPDPTLILMYVAAATPTPTSLPVPATGTAAGSVSAGGLPLGGPLIGVGVLALLGGATVLHTRTRRRR